MANVIRFQVPEATQLEVAFADWLGRRAYLDNGGNYRLNATRRVAPWNKLVKRTFSDRFLGLHDAAHAWQDARRAS